MSTTTMKIEDLAQWSQPKSIHTKQGPRRLRTAEPTDLFWRAWKASKETLKQAGVSVGKDPRSGVWQACWWLSDEQAEERIEASRATDANLEIPCPEGLEYMPFQKAGIAYIASRQGAIVGDEMGLGKTVQAIGLINLDKAQQVLIVCPASLRLNWRNELRRWLVQPLTIAVVNGGTQKDWDKAGADTAQVVVINYDVTSKHRARIDARGAWDILICDEGHLLKNPDTARTRSILGHKQRDGKIKLAPIQAKRKVFLSGTPILNRPVELWPIVQAIDPDGLGKNFFGFAKRYCGAYMNSHGWDFTGATNLEELQQRLRSSCMVRRLKSEVLTELPAKIHQVIELPANGSAGVVAKELQAYDSYQDWIEKLEDELRALELGGADAFQQGEVRRKLADARRVAFTEMAGIRHEVALAKCPKAIEYLASELEEGPIVVFAHHRDVIAQIVEAFPGRTVSITGDTPLDQRQAAVEAFQEGKADLFVGNIQAAGVGLTLTRSSRVIFVELDWVPANMAQASDRCHRIGQTSSVLVKYLVLEGSLDERMAQVLIQKQSVTQAALDQETPKYQPTGDSAVVADQAAPKASQADAEAVEITLAAPEPGMPETQSQAILMGLRMLAGMCDGARSLDGCGFNKLDNQLGHELACLEKLSPRQAAIGQRMIRTYRKQLPAALVTTATGDQ